MSNGYLVAAQADIAAARELGEGFELDVLELGALGGDAAIPMLASAGNVGIVLSAAGTREPGFYDLVQKLGMRLPMAQLILVEPTARTQFGFLPTAWPDMPLDEARRRASELKRRREPPPPAPVEPQAPVHAAPLEPLPPPLVQEAPVINEEPPPAPVASDDERARGITLTPESDEPVEPEPANEPPPSEPYEEAAVETVEALDVQLEEAESPTLPIPPLHVNVPDDFGGEPPPVLREEPVASATADDGLAEHPHEQVAPQEAIDADEASPLEGNAPSVEAPLSEAESPPIESPFEISNLQNEFKRSELDEEPLTAEADVKHDEPAEAPASTEDASIEAPPAPAPAAPAPSFEYQSNASVGSVTGATRSRGSYNDGLRGGLGASALTADASAFAPKKLRRETPELVRVVIHQPHQLKAVLKAAKKIDPRAEAAPQGMRLGDVAVGESVGVSLDVRGATCDGAMQRRVWRGEPIDFSFTVQAEDGVKQAVILARVFVGDAQVGVVAFTRPITGAAPKAAAADRAKLKRHKHVFLSYSSQDRETVSAIATAYEAAGITYFWDRSSLKSGEEWSPRLRKEIDRADLFHLCWSKAASKSEWVLTEAEHALTRRQRSNGKQPDITVQMLDGPPWAPHPTALDSINFDDFVRAAVVGYARGDGGDAA